MAASTYFETVQKLYIAYYQRPADPSGLLYWAQRIDAAGGNLNAAIDAFATSAESQTLYGTIDSTTIGSFIDRIYQALFNREPDAAGKQFYIDGFNAGTFTPGSIALDILNGAQNDDAVAIQNKVLVANLFTEAVDGRPMTDPDFGTGSSFAATYAGDADAQAARTFLAGVTSNPTTIKSSTEVTQEIQNNIADAGDPIKGATTGQTFTLTNGVDNVTGTSGNDTIVGDNNTASAADQINGGAGTDTLKLYNSSGNPVLPTISGIENIYIKSSTADYDVSTISGLTSLEIDTVNVNAAARAYTLASGQSLTLTNVTDSGNSGNDVDVNAAASVTGQTIKLNGVGDTAGNDVEIDINGTGVATLNVEAVGASNITLINTGGALKTLNVSGNKDLKIGDVPGATTIAVTNSASTTLSTSVVTNNGLAITGGTGKETITLAQAAGANALSNKTSVDLGAGDDTLVISALTAANNIQDGASFKGGDGTDTLNIVDGAVLDATRGKLFSGFETIDLAGSTGTFDLANLATNNTIGTLKVSAATNGAVTVNNLPEVASVVISAAINAGGLTINQKDAGAGSPDDVLNITFDSKAALTTTDNIDINDIETVNVSVTSSGANITHTVTKLIADEATKITVNASTAAVTISDLDSKALVLFDASASAKAVSLTTGADTYNATAGVAFKLGSGNDTLDLTGADTSAAAATDLDFLITGGAGADTITLAAVANGKDVLVYTAQTDSTYAKYDTINNFDANATSAQDFIDLKAFGFTGNQQNVKVVTSGVSLAADNSVVVASGSQANFFVDTGLARGVAVWGSGDDVFVFVDANKDGNFSNDADLVIKLAGVANATDITNTDLIFA
jgi:hypothetical protein